MGKDHGLSHRPDIVADPSFLQNVIEVIFMKTAIHNSLENTAIELFGLDPSVIQHISTAHGIDQILVEVTLRPDFPPCPRCGSHRIVVYNYTPRAITHSVLQDHKCTLIYNARRYKCKDCHRTYGENNPFSLKKQRISLQTSEAILRDLRSPNETFASVAARYHVSATTAMKIFDMNVSYPQANRLCRVLQLDETYSFKSDDSRYVCMLLDYDRQIPVDVLPSRRKEYLAGYFRQFPRSEREKVEYIASDMYRPYRDMASTFFPKAVFAVDRFHVTQEYTRQMNKVKIRVMKGTRKGSSEYYLLKHQYELLSVRPDARNKDRKLILDPSGPRFYVHGLKRRMNRYELLNELLEISPDLEEAYRFRNRLSEYFREGTLSTAEEELRTLIAGLDSTGVAELQDFANTLRTWFKEVVNSFHIVKREYIAEARTGKVYVKNHRLTSSMIENRNKIIKMIKHNSNGYSNWERFRNRVLYVLSSGPEDGHPDLTDRPVN